MVELTGFYAFVYAIGLITLAVIFGCFIGLLAWIAVGIFQKIFILFSKGK